MAQQSQGGLQGPSGPSPFFMPQLVPTAGQHLTGLPLQPAAGPLLGSSSGGSGSLSGGTPSAVLLPPQYFSSAPHRPGSGSHQTAMSLQDQVSLPGLGPGPLATGSGGAPFLFDSAALGGGLPAMPLGYLPMQQPGGAPAALHASGGSASAGAGAAAAAKGASRKPAPGGRRKRDWKTAEQVQAEKREAEQKKERGRRLEQELGRAKMELRRLQAENQALQHKATVLKKHNSFRRCTAAMVTELTQSLTMGQRLSAADWSQQSLQRGLLDSVERRLPAPDVMERLRKMNLEEAVQFYNSVVAQVRGLLQQIKDGSPARELAQRQLEELFSLENDKRSTFGYLQVVNPQVYAELMQAKLDPDSPVSREDPTHWRMVLAAMQLSEEQEAQLILLLQSHLVQSEQVVERKSRVMQQLADELSQDLLTLELSSELSGSGEVPDLQPENGRTGDAGPANSEELAARQAKEELDRLIQLEYWLKYDFTGCVRKLLPAEKQALCMVSSWPFYPDQRQLEAAIKDKAGQLWDQLRRTNS